MNVDAGRETAAVPGGDGSLSVAALELSAFPLIMTGAGITLNLAAPRSLHRAADSRTYSRIFILLTVPPGLLATGAAV